MLKFLGIQKAELVDNAREKYRWLSMQLLALAATITSVWALLSVADQAAILELAPWVQQVLSVCSVLSILASMRGRLIKQPGLGQ